MAQCKFCSKKGFFLSVSKAGLCNNCHDPVVMSIESNLKVLNESIKLVNTSKKFETRMGRIQTAIEQCEILQREYWSKGITIFEPVPSEAIKNLKEEKEKIISSEITARVERHLDKSNRSQTAKSKITNADKALDELLKFKQEYSYENHELEETIKAYIHKAQYDEYIQNAEKNEFKGNINKAIDQYQEALFFLKKDSIPDSEQQQIIADLETKIKNLKDNKIQQP